MLSSLVLELTPAGRGISGKHVHGWFFETFLRERHPELASALHAQGGHKPFTVGVVVVEREGPGAGLSHGLRVTSVNGALSAWLDQFSAADFGMIPLGERTHVVRRVCRRSTEHPWADATSWRGLWDRAARHPAPGRVRLRFATPTAFDHDRRDEHGRRERRNRLFPEGRLVFDALARSWAAAAALTIEPDSMPELPVPVRQELVTRVREEAYQLQTVPPVRFGRFSEKGFTGTCEYSVGGDAPTEVVTALHVLAEFAFYTGTGMRTTMGMGQTECLAGGASIGERPRFLRYRTSPARTAGSRGSPKGAAGGESYGEREVSVRQGVPEGVPVGGVAVVSGDVPGDGKAAAKCLAAIRLRGQRWRRDPR